MAKAKTTKPAPRRRAPRETLAQLTRRARLAVRAIDDLRDSLVSGQRSQDRDRYHHDRDEVLRDALDAWRVNPLAKRIVSLTTQYVVGAGITIEARHEPTGDFLQAWWSHRLNRMAVRASEWCDELTRSGNLIVLVSTDAMGMSYLRAIPAAHVLEIRTAPNDVEQPVEIVEKLQWGETEGQRWPAYDAASDRPNEDGAWPTVALHYAINRPVGATWGESDLAPLLRWLARYANWLDDRRDDLPGRRGMVRQRCRDQRDAGRYRHRHRQRRPDDRHGHERGRRPDRQHLRHGRQWHGYRIQSHPDPGLGPGRQLRRRGVSHRGRRE